MIEWIMTDRERTALQLSRVMRLLEKAWPMIESKHTPGPWEWTRRNGYHELVGANGVVVHSDGSAAGEYCADIDVTGSDARLIAAAPDLLEACQVCLELEDSISVSIEPDEVRAMLCAAIAKATGEKP